MTMTVARFFRTRMASLGALTGFLCLVHVCVAQAQSVPQTPIDAQTGLQDLLEDAPWRSARQNGLSTRAVHTSNPRLSQLARHLALEVGSRDQIRLVNILGRNDVINLSDLFYLRGIDSVFIRSDAVEYVKRRNEFPGITRVVNSLARLYEERIVVLAQPSIESINALDQKTIAVGLKGSGEHITGSLVLELSGVQAQLKHTSTLQALEQLESREIDAAILLLGPDSDLASDSGGVGNAKKQASWWRMLNRRDIQVLPLEFSEAISNVYVESRLTEEDLPGLVGEIEGLPTLAVQTILAAYRWSPRNPRFEMASRFVRTFMESQVTLQQGDDADIWQGLDFEFDVPGVPQLSTVRTVLRERAAVKTQAIEARAAQKAALMAERMSRLEQMQAQIDELISERLGEATDEDVNQLQQLIEELSKMVDDVESGNDDEDQR